MTPTAARPTTLVPSDATRIGAFWIDQKIRSGSAPPRTIATLDMLLRVLVSLKGSMGYVHMAPNAVPAGLVALTIDGKPPTDPAYALAN